MKLKTIALVLSILLLTLAGAAWAEVVGKLTRVEGAVDVMPGGQLPAVAAKEGSPLQKGDFVRTKSNSKAEITFNDGSVVKVAQRSRLDVSEYSGASRKLGLPRGKVQATVVPAAAGGARQTFEIRTPNAIAGVRGTSFFVYHQANVTGVAVLEGVVHTSSVSAPSKGVTLVAGTATTVAKSKAPTPPRPVTPAEMNSHQSDVTAKPQSSAPSAGAPAAGGETSSATTGTSGATSGTSTTSGTATSTEGTSGATGTSTTSSGETTSGGTATSGTATSTEPTTSATSTTSNTSLASLSTETIATASTSFDQSLQTYNSTEPETNPVVTNPDTNPDTTPPPPPPPPVEPVAPPEPTPTPTPEPPKPLFSSTLGAGLMSRDAIIDPNSSLLKIINDPGIAPTLSGTTSLWTGSAPATLTGTYPSLSLQQPNHYWQGHFFSESTANQTTADGGAYVGYFGGMSLDGSRTTDTRLTALYIDPNGKAGIMQGSLPGTISGDATAGFTMNGSGTLTLTEMTPTSGITPANLAAGWWDPKAGTTVVEVGPGHAISDFSSGTTSGTGGTGTTTGTTTGGTGGTGGGFIEGKDTGSPSEGFLLDSGINFAAEMDNRGDVLRLGYLAADPSFGIWSRESFGSYGGTGSQFVLTTNAEWGTTNTDGTFTMSDIVRVVSLGKWQEGELTGTADGVWGNLATGSIKLLTGELTGSANPTTKTFGAVTAGSFISLDRFVANPSLAQTLGFPTVLNSNTFSLSGSGASGSGSSGSVDFGNLKFYSRTSTDPVMLWVAPNVTGHFSGTLDHQRFSLMNGTDPATSTVMGDMFINSTSAANTWIGRVNAIGETGTSTASLRSDFDGVAAGTFSGTTFTGAAAGLSHPVTYFSRIDGTTAQLTRYSGGAITSYGALDGVVGGMSLWSSTDLLPSDFKAIGFFTPSQTLTGSDYVFSAPIFSKDIPNGTNTTADGGAYTGHIVAGVNAGGGSSTAPGITGIMNALYVDPSGNTGILCGKFGGFLDHATSLWTADGDIVPVALGGTTLSAASLTSSVTNRTINYGATGSTFTGVPGLGAWAPGTYTRSFITSSPEWGIAQFGLYAPYSAPPTDGSNWFLDFTITDGTVASNVLTGNMAGSKWYSTSGVLFAGTRGGWLDMQSAVSAATPTTGIFIGETVGTFNPSSLQAMTSGVWMETSKFISLASTAAGQNTLKRLNIPSVEVGKASFSGGNGNFDVTLNDLRFFAPTATDRPQLFATDSISGTYHVANPVGSATLNPIAGATAVSGINPTFTIKQWDGINNKWSGGLSYNGPGGTVAGSSNVQFDGVAAGRISGGVPGTFSGTAAGHVR